jgi:molecular chaperone HscB
VNLAVLDFSKNHFELFDLPQGFAVDAKRLAERYRALQAVIHPDRFAVAPDHQQIESLQASAQVNEAYRTLKDPLARARYLLTLYTGEPGTASEISKDGSLLMEQMELRETVAEAQSSSNPAAAVARVLTQLAEQSVALDKELEGLFADPSPTNLESAREIVRKLQFLDKCRGDVGDLGTPAEEP